MSETSILNASPVITMAKAGYLYLFDQLAAKLLIPEPGLLDTNVIPEWVKPAR